MKFLLKDSVVAKLRKVPTFVWILLLAASFFFARAYVTITEAQTIVATYLDTMESMGFTGVDEGVFTSIGVVMSVVASAFIYAGIFELFMRIIHNVALRRFAVAINVSDFIFRLRLVMIVANVILGIVGIFFFFFPKIIDVVWAIFRYAVPTVFFALFYDDFRRKYVPKRNVYKLFVFIARIYIIIYFAISLFTSVYEYALYSASLTALEIASLAIDPAIIAISALAALFYAMRLKKVSEEDNDIFIKQEETPDKKDDNVFKDLGF